MKKIKHLDKVILGENIRMARLKKRVSQRELAEFCGVKQSKISTVERGECFPSIELAFNIATFLGVKLEDLAPRN